MGKEPGKQVKLGMFVTASLVVLLVAVYFVGQKQNLFGSSFRLSGTFKDVSGLQVGNNVRLAGVNVGSVESVTITSNHAVRVDLLISEDAHRFIHKDAEASVGAESMMGNKVVLLAPGNESEPQVANHDVIRTAVSAGFDEILKKIELTSENAALIMDNVAHLTGKIRSGRGTLGKLLMDDELAGDVGTTLANLKEASIGFKELTTEAKSSWLLWGFGKKKTEAEEHPMEGPEVGLIKLLR